MISLVILDHILPHLTKSMLYIQFWLRLSVPVFLIIMGFNYGHSFQFNGYTSLREIYSKGYFNRKFKRYIIPFLLIFIPLTIISTILDQFGVRVFSNREILPFWGPGVWYIPVVLTAVLVLPAIYLLFMRKPYLTITLCFVCEFIMHFFLYYILQTIQTGTSAYDLIRFLFLSNILLYPSAIAVGLLFSTEHNLFSKQNRFILIALPMSLMYIILYQFAELRPFFLMSDYNFMITPYSAFIFLIFMKFLPESSHWFHSSVFTIISKSTYHILLVQIVIFSILYHFVPGMVIGNIVFSQETYLVLFISILVMSFLIGILWQDSENKRIL
jgi:hypothetical protein